MWLEIVLLYVVGLVLIIVEVFMPGGFIGVLGTIALGASVYIGFAKQGPLIGTVQLIIAVGIIPLAFYFGLKRLALKKALTVEEGYRSDKPILTELIGQEGMTITPLRPSGIASFNNRKIDVVTEGGLIGPNTAIKVVRVEGNRVIVRAKTQSV
jgi:membrane-bound serine protease (ClpP class)